MAEITMELVVMLLATMTTQKMVAAMTVTTMRLTSTAGRRGGVSTSLRWWQRPSPGVGGEQRGAGTPCRGDEGRASHSALVVPR